MQKYMKIQRVGSQPTQYLYDANSDELIIEEKIDGCFPYETKIATEIGMLPIGKIVNEQLPIKVKSYNKITGELEYKPVINWYKNGQSKTWFNITYESNKHVKSLILTPNHKVYDGSKFKPISEFMVGDYIYIDTPDLTQIQYNVMLGSILGDGSILNMSKTKNPLYSEAHSIKQSEYMNFKKNIFKNIITKYIAYTNKENEEYKEREMCKIISKSLDSIYENFNDLYIDGKKHISNNIINNISPMAIAIWYCDDGSISITDKQRPRITLSTHAFTEEECKILLEALNKYNIVGKCFNYGKGIQITIDSDNTEKFCELIAQYVPPCMDYKLPDIYKNQYKDYDIIYKNIKAYRIIGIDECVMSKQKYDIEVEDNHNYFAKGVLVSNSNFRFKIEQDGGVTFGSHNTILGTIHDIINGPFKPTIDYIKGKLAPKDLSQYTDLEIFGEAIIPHSICYDWLNMPPFIGFDVMKNGVYLPYDAKVEILKSLELPIVQLIERTTVADFMTRNLCDTTVPPSVYGKVQAEGIVVKNYRTQCFLKFVTAKFKEVNRQKFGGTGAERPVNDNERLVSKYCPNPRIDKKIYELQLENHALDMTMMVELPKRVWNDIVEEAASEILNENWVIDLRGCRKEIARRCKAVLEMTIARHYQMSAEVVEA